MPEEIDVNKRELLGTEAKCSSCGGGLLFDPPSQELKCPFCSTITPFNKRYGEFKNSIQGVNEDNESHNKWAKEMKVVKCGSCGAEIILNGLETTKNCPYCGSDYVVNTDQLAGLKPDIVIPFLFNEEEASKRFVKGIKKKFFAPRVLKKSFPKSKIHGIFLPTFTFDTHTYTMYNGVLEKVTHYTDAKGKSHTKVNRFNIKGELERDNPDYLVETSSKVVPKEMNALLPYDFSKSCGYDTNFLRGYGVEHYQDSLESCYATARKEMEASIRRAILSRYDYTNVVSLNMKHIYSNELYSYRLMPVYCFEYEYKNKHYLTYMNGQTGKIGTGYPTSKLKKALVIILTIIGIAAIVLLLILLSE